MTTSNSIRNEIASVKELFDEMAARAPGASTITRYLSFMSFIMTGESLSQHNVSGEATYLIAGLAFYSLADHIKQLRENYLNQEDIQ